MELLSSFRSKFKEITPSSQGPCLRVTDAGRTLEAGYYIFGTAERTFWLKADLKDRNGRWLEAFRWPSDGSVLDWTPQEERYLEYGLRTTREGRTAPSGLEFEDWIRSRLEKILRTQSDFALHPEAYSEAEAESVLERVRPALEAFLSGELFRAARPLIKKVGISDQDFARIRQDHPEAQRHELLAYMDALQNEKRLLARAAAQGGRWSETFGEFLVELESGSRGLGRYQPEDFETWWRDSGVNAALIAAAPEIPDEALKRALRNHPL